MVNVRSGKIVEAVSSRSCGFAVATIALATDDTSGPFAGTSAEDKAVSPEEDEVDSSGLHQVLCLLLIMDVGHLFAHVVGQFHLPMAN